jgi:hypothetical protein
MGTPGHTTKVRMSDSTPGMVASRPPVTREVRPDDLPLSYAQQRLWFVHQLEGGTNEYNMLQAWKVRCVLDVGALAAALNALVERHESLRTHIGEVDGRPVQVIEPNLTVDLPCRDLTLLSPAFRPREIEDELRKAWEQPFDLMRGPLLRAQLVRTEEQEHILILTIHHLVTDGWSDAILIRELGMVYDRLVQGRDPVLPPLDLQYADFALWQRRSLESGALAEGLDYWRTQLAGIAGPLKLRGQRTRPNGWARGETRRLVLGAALCRDLRRLARQEITTFSTTLLAAFQIVLARWSGQTDIPVGVVVSNRTVARLGQLMGFFVNLVVIRGDLSRDLTYRDFLRQTGQLCLDAYARQEVPLEKLVEELNPERNPGVNPLFQVVFNFLNFPRTPPEIAGVPLEKIHVVREVRAPFDLKVDITGDDETCLDFTYNATLYDAATMAALTDEFERLLQQIVDNPDGQLDTSGQQTPEQKVLAELFADVLGVQHVGLDDDFFALGGHSLLVMWLRNRIRTRLGADIPLRTVVEAPTVRQLSTFIDRLVHEPID